MRVGLAGAGPWARAVHAPLLAAGPETELAGVWSRTPAHAAELAAAHGVPVFDSYDAMLDAVDAVALAVVPAAQPDLAVAAADAGQGAPAREAARARRRRRRAHRRRGRRQRCRVGDAAHLPVRRRRARLPRRRARRAPGTAPVRASSRARSSAARSPAGWRLELGAVLDVGPHILDLVEAALGPVVEVTAQGDPHDWVAVQMLPRERARAATSIAVVRERDRAEPHRGRALRARAFARGRRPRRRPRRVVRPGPGRVRRGGSLRRAASVRRRARARAPAPHRPRRTRPGQPDRVSVALVVDRAPRARRARRSGIRHLYLRLDRPGGMTCSLRVAHGSMPGLGRRSTPATPGRRCATCSGAGSPGPARGVVFPLDAIRVDRERRPLPGERWRVPASFSILPVELGDGVVLELAIPRHRLRRLVGPRRAA